MQLSRLSLRGFKSIREMDIELRPINVLIGANGAGKSNLLSFFRLLNEFARGRLPSYVPLVGGPDALLYRGRKETSAIAARLEFGGSHFSLALSPTADNQLLVTQDSSSNPLASLALIAREWRTYQFHDTGDTAKVKGIHDINDNEVLRPDAENLAAFLLLLRKTSPRQYEAIRDTVRLMSPFFGDFHLRPLPENPILIQLEWTERWDDQPFLAHRLPDGTLRFICLATLLLQPAPPALIVIDEPELGLHPYAVAILASLLRSASHRTQIVVATQSVRLVDEFAPEDLIVVDRPDRPSQFRRLEVPKLTEWLDEYSLGELWEKNVLGGRPSR